jgi:hypothetical protein
MPDYFIDGYIGIDETILGIRIKYCRYIHYKIYRQLKQENYL